MEVNFTDIIEKLIIRLPSDLLGKGGEKWGRLFAKIYRAYYKPFNFAIVGLIGVALYYLIQLIIQNIIGNILAIFVAFFWAWTMTVGPLGSWWGFGTQTQKALTKETKTNKQTKDSSKWQTCQRKTTIVEFRKVVGESEKIFTPAGELEVLAKDFFIIRGVDNELYPIKKDIFKKTYNVTG